MPSGPPPSTGQSRGAASAATSSGTAKRAAKMRDGQICKAWDILPMIRHASLRGADRGAKPTPRSRWGGRVHGVFRGGPRGYSEAGGGIAGSAGGGARGGTRKGSPLGRKRGGGPGMFPAGLGFAEFDEFDGFVSRVPGGSFASGWASKMGSFGNSRRRRLRRSNSSTARRYIRSDWAW